ncbi:MAG: DUF1822 family protein [Cyanobacteria bacterium P01_F01_bin.150]
MVYGHYETDEALVLPITQQGRDIAQQFVDQNPISSHGERIRLNTLAVWVVNDYLTLMGIPTHLALSDSWNPMMRLAGDMADLEVDGLGKLECRPIRETDQECDVPPETWELRIGYLVVEIDKTYRQAKLLGFAPTVTSETLSRQRLRPLDDFIDHLADLRQTASAIAPSPIPPDEVPERPFNATESETASSIQSLVPTDLAQWLNNIVEAGWQQLDQFLNPQTLAPAYAFRSTNDPMDEQGTGEGREDSEDIDIERAKLVDLGIQLGACQVVLVVQLKRESSQTTDITLQLYPEPGQAFLALGVDLQVLDDGGSVFLQTQSRDADNYIQLKFSGDRSEQFTVRIALGEAAITESFII